MTEQGTDLSGLIDRVCGQLKIETEWVRQQANILQSTADSSTHEEFAGLAGHCDELVQKAQAAGQELTSAGIEDWVYSVKACHEVAFRAHEAAGHARSAAASAYPTEIRSMLESCVNALDNAVYSINGT